MDREYIIAGFRIRLEQADRLFVRPGSHMARAFEPFAAEADPAAPLTMRLIPDCTINKKLTGGEPNRELDVFPFDDAEAIIGKTRCDEVQNEMRLLEGWISPKRKVTKISHTYQTWSKYVSRFHIREDL